MLSEDHPILSRGCLHNFNSEKIDSTCNTNSKKGFSSNPTLPYRNLNFAEQFQMHQPRQTVIRTAY